MNCLDVYNKEFSNTENDYRETMPDWLKEEAKKEMDILIPWITEWGSTRRGDKNNIIDAGCGDGILADRVIIPTLKQSCGSNFKYHMLDASPVAIERVKENVTQKSVLGIIDTMNFDTVNCISDFYRLLRDYEILENKKTDRIDLAIAMGLTPHIDNIVSFLENILVISNRAFVQFNRNDTPTAANLTYQAMYNNMYYNTYNYRQIRAFLSLAQGEIEVVKFDMCPISMFLDIRRRI